MTRIVVTGASGFVGRATTAALAARGLEVVALLRRPDRTIGQASEWLHPAADFAGLGEPARPFPDGVDAVIHAAARVHVMREAASEAAEAAFVATNVAGSLRVARAARERGARRFVFVSSIKAVAERDHGEPLDERTPPAPEDAYGRSKLQAELALREYGASTGMEIVIVRPPLVYGAGVRANFMSMMRAVARGLPLPLGAITARRSLVHVGNLADALALCALDARAAGAAGERCFHVADAGSLTVSELLRAIGRHLGRPARLLPVPVPVLRALGRATGRGAQIDRLTQNLRVSHAALADALDWQPPISTDEGLAATARWYRSTTKHE
ncbi:NAD-dependent epimerase/dehydratase family protein [Burkholderia glumae]|uniref:NAD-dependent epimerase/dehydratase family protein n=1 Tax=Burkholderia glumae TaxID=337 RepID=UPI002150A821|nr:NAD-dependent epimerase/dehydratase family protein [Burkholderia glumae]UVS95015.1 NAD-dependent epimerase/dehydratase family protein [Burkholderia glumae]